MENNRLHDFENHEREIQDIISKRYDTDYHGHPIMDSWDESFFDVIKDNYQKGDRILDIGCGPGSIWKYLKRLESPGCLVGIDLSPGMIAEAQKKYPDGDFRVGSVLALPFEAGAFDMVIASSVLHHVPDEYLEKALQEIYRVLDEHGRFIGREPVGDKKFGTQPGWFSGALMHFRHFLYSSYHVREYPEPALGDNHHAYEPKEFYHTLTKHFKVSYYRFFHPVSPFFSRLHTKWAVDLAVKLDSLVDKVVGNIFVYIGKKNHSSAVDVNSCIENYLNEAYENKVPLQFLAFLRQAANYFEKESDKYARK
ncbi:methyltransferase domain-containing protein [Heliobacterium undosum]|uniref:Methyltransferase domain-containing protein n=1 Tax=Heliomicrobium undosum TaxID=121734 RepID=A0A845L4E8_9FIRM|nr:class I SAM-dependent methyltransferase [Heliomicrobium undosum]MZP29510.1 methyltransferase domain-containing protein [Heliomicrobium undosum]